jgi:hypothetical protein
VWGLWLYSKEIVENLILRLFYSHSCEGSPLTTI